MPRTSRFIVMALLVAVVSAAGLWTAWLVTELTQPLSTTGHHDFFSFYAAATLVHIGRPQLLYDPATVTALERLIFPHPTGYAGYLPYLNPPSAAVLLSPLSQLSYANARLLWLGLGVLTAIACVAMLTRGMRQPAPLLAVIAIFGTFPAYQTLVEGQWSYVMLLGALAALRLAASRRDWLAGAVLVVLWLKPPLLLLVLLWLLLTRRWKIAGGAAAAVLALTLLTLPWTGLESNLRYAQYLVNVGAAHAAGGGAAGATAWEGAFANMEGLLGLAAAVVGQQHPAAVDVVTVALAVLVTAVLLAGMRHHWGRETLPLRLGVAALCTGLLLDPHLYAQDCLVLVLPAALVLWHRNRTATTVLVGVCVLMDLSAIDTLWSQGLFPLPLHLLTGALIATVVVASLMPRLRSARQRPAWSSHGL
jgi:Glycosyltransferase family 87